MSSCADSEDDIALTAHGYCSWHRGYARAVRLIRVEEAGSGPNAHGCQYACFSCREAYDLVPLADLPL
ncbi:hypothetical protein [Streptomyces sp. NPDC060001]|uniref:hypothetical protein n=1 Tax=Streptomyces sp. NPDC060001 TaxID=3347032 RepID=UPI00368486F1